MPWFVFKGSQAVESCHASQWERARAICETERTTMVIIVLKVFHWFFFQDHFSPSLFSLQCSDWWSHPWCLCYMLCGNYLFSSSTNVKTPEEREEVEWENSIYWSPHELNAGAYADPPIKSSWPRVVGLWRQRIGWLQIPESPGLASVELATDKSNFLLTEPLH